MTVARSEHLAAPPRATPFDAVPVWGAAVAGALVGVGTGLLPGTAVLVMAARKVTSGLGSSRATPRSNIT